MAAVAETLMQRMDATKPLAKPSRVLLRRCTEEKAERSIKRNCGGISASTIAEFRENGMPLTEKVMNDMRGAHASGGRLGCAYWSALMAQLSKDEEWKPIVPRDTSLAIGDDLKDALRAAIGGHVSQRKVTALVICIKGSDHFNSLEFAGLLNATAMIAKRQQKGADEVTLALASYVARTNSQDTYADDVATLRVFFDKALGRSWAKIKNCGVSLGNWIACNSDVLPLVLDMSDVNAALSAKGQWVDVAGPLRRLTCNSQVGMLMFRGALSETPSEEFGQQLSKLIDAWASGVLSEDSLKTLRGDALALGASFRDKCTRGPTRVIKIKFLGAVLGVPCADIRLGCDLRVAAVLKTMSVGRKKRLASLAARGVGQS